MNDYIKPNEHVSIFGMTGSGKTFLAKAYLKGYKNIVIHDPKGTFNFQPFLTEEQESKMVEYAYSLDELDGALLRGSKHPTGIKIIYRPSMDEFERESWEVFFEWCFHKGNMIVVVDECADITTSTYIPKYYKAILTKGRELGISVWSLSQRPAGISQWIFSQTTHTFIFKLPKESDRKRLYENIGYKEVLTAPRKFEFYYYNVNKEGIILNKLKIKTKLRSGIK